MAQAGVLASMLAPLLVAGADTGANILIDNQAAIVAELKSIEGEAVTFIENELLAAIPSTSIAQKIVAGEIDDTIKNAATEIAAQLGAADSTLLNTVELQLEAIASKYAS